MKLYAIDDSTTLDALDNWGKFSAIGAEDLGGDVEAFGRMTLGAPGDATSAGYFGTRRGSFRLHYPFTEQATLLSGEVRMVNEQSGEQFHFRAGDSWLIAQGTITRWEVLSDDFVKHYLAVASSQ
ncbi:DUF861 domain-containing protein [Shimwellia pseudoproteus]|uniref:cupin domain-containing protein n=1 Tax=Shimwellia pseudoproteus TaxID=570012 RepID=UPI0018EE4336|nr:cupin domain-containing protein [Shimwellia pseudoproteus]MBJ3813863.1 DUF861 domain-containing protein [Shimwellia pseudoproteus]